MSLSMDDIMRASFGSSEDISCAVKKTINIRQYESEVVEYETTLKVEEKISGAERMLIAAILEAQLEYNLYINLHLKGFITNTEINDRREELIRNVSLIKEKAEEVLGVSMDKYFKYSELGEV